MAVLANKFIALERLSALTSFYLPEIPCSLPLKSHPDYLRLCRQADEWAFKYMGIKTREDKKRLTQWRMPLYSTLAIRVGGYEEALAACKFMWLAPFMDDPVDNAHSAAEHFQKTFLSLGLGTESLSEAPDQPATKAYDDLMADFQRLMLPPVYNRLTHTHKRWAESFWNEPLYTEESNEIHRGNNYFMSIMSQFTEMCLGIALKDEELEDPDYLGMFNAISDHAWLVHDVITLPKELEMKKFRNYVLVLLLGDPNVDTIQDAVNKICRMIQEKEEEFIYYSKIAMAKASESSNHDFLRYLETLRALVPANWYWHYITARYHGVDNPFVTGDPFHGTWYLYPDQTIVVPPLDKAKQSPYLEL